MLLLLLFLDSILLLLLMLKLPVLFFPLQFLVLFKMEGNLFRYYAFACFVLVGTASLAVSLVISRYVSHIDPFAQVKLKMSEKKIIF